MFVDIKLYNNISSIMFITMLIMMLIVLKTNFGYNKIIVKIYNIIMITCLAVFYSKYIVRSHDSVKYYIPFYENNTWRTFEPLYTVINNIGRLLNLNSNTFLFLLSFFSLLIFFYYANKILCKEKSFMLLIYALFSSISFNFIYIGLLRQAISISIIMIAMNFYIQNDKKKSLIFIIIASLIHYSSLIFVGVFIIEKLDKKFLKWIIIISIIIGTSNIVYYLIDGVLLKIFNEGTIKESLIRIYRYAQFNNKHSEYIIKYIIGLVSYIITYKIVFKNNMMKYLDKYIYILSVLIISVSSTYFAHETSARMLNVFNIFSIITWIKIYSEYNFRHKNLVLIILILVLFTYSIFSHKWICEFISRVI